MSRQDEDKKHVVEVCEEFLESAINEDIFLKSIITAVTTWVYGYDIRVQSSPQRKSRNFPRLKKAGSS